MKMNTALCVAATALALSVPAALAEMPGMDMQKMMMPKPDDSASTKDLKQAHMDMMHNMNIDFTGNPDADFARSMIKHHRGGIEMAKIQLKYGKDPEIREMAEKLIKDQGGENDKFEAWLKNNPR